MSGDDYRPLFGAPVAPWHTWFAWRPVNTVDRGWRWLRLVHRRRVQKHLYLPGPGDFWWQFAVEVEAPREHATHIGGSAVIPSWRYYLALYATWVLGMIGQRLWDGVGFWAFAIASVASGTIWTLILGRYEKRRTP